MRPLILLVTLLAAGCTSTGPVSQDPGSARVGSASPSIVSIDPDYGYTQAKPIKVGGVNEGPARQRAYLGQLRGPAGEPVRFERQGSCCPFPTKAGFMGSGLLDRYAVWIESDSEPRILYLNLYDYEEPKVPVGFTKADD